jgi:hypothetical protein
MKELFSAFSAAVFYPLVSLALPGLTAISGWFVYLMGQPGFRGLVGRNHTEAGFIVMLNSIFVGTVIDDLGTRLERAIANTSSMNTPTYSGHPLGADRTARRRHSIISCGRRSARATLGSQRAMFRSVPVAMLTTCCAGDAMTR